MNFFSYIFATAVLSILSHQTISEENVTQNAVIEPAHNVTLPPLAVVKREVVQEDLLENVDQPDPAADDIDQPDPAANDIDQPEPADDDDMSETVAKRDVEQQQQQQVPQKAGEEHRVAAPQESSNQTGGPQANGGVYSQPIFHGK
ncbi:hypothetical protein GPALN_004857 [Globodera pallida]|nr:hypothetical protein GPALN_004857 [Globodera pallida]